MTEITEKHLFIALPEAVEIVASPDMAHKGQILSYERDLDEHTCNAFAKQIDIPGVKSIRLKIKLTPFNDGIILDLDYDCSLIRQCVVSLEDFEMTHKDQQSVKLLLARSFENYQERMESDPQYAHIQLDENDPELLDETGVQLISLGLEILSVNLDAYPKKADADATTVSASYISEAEEGQSDTHKPFANLANLLKKSKEE